jgi:hypothetical protein
MWGADTLVHQQHDGIVVGSTSSYVIIAYLHFLSRISIIFQLFTWIILLQCTIKVCGILKHTII